jgi:hypothetical protein
LAARYDVVGDCRKKRVVTRVCTQIFHPFSALVTLARDIDQQAPGGMYEFTARAMVTALFLYTLKLTLAAFGISSGSEPDRSGECST